MQTRSDKLRSMFNFAGKGLEIGPSHNPLMPKSLGFDVETLDYLDAEGLREKYSRAGLDSSAVEEVDFVSDGSPMSKVIGASHRYDWIVASHVIEHVPDLISFFVECEKLLKPGRPLVLAVPDKRCCFDVLRPVSSIGQVLQAHYDARERPMPGVIFDDVAYARTRAGKIGWSTSERAQLKENVSLTHAWNVCQAARSSSTYIDVHCWVFVPSSFCLILGALNEIGLIRLAIVECVVNDGEFFVVLSDGGKSGPFDLGNLALAGMAEEFETSVVSSDREVALKLTQSELERARHKYETEMLELRNHQKESLHIIRQLTSSTSWKMTAPLRTLARLIKKMGGIRDRVRF